MYISLKKGLRENGAKGVDAVRHVYLQRAFAPQNPDVLTKDGRDKVPESLMFLEKKRVCTVNGCLVANGSKQRNYVDEGSATSPTVMTNSYLSLWLSMQVRVKMWL